jgi:hypothetical protein
MTNHIDLTNYKLQRIIDGNERYSINTGSLSPLAAREIQRNLAANKKSRKIIYTTPNGDKFSVLVDERQFQELSDLRDGKWRLIESLKSTKAETRKPASGLRQLGLIIGTKHKPGQYKLFGEIELYPIGLCIGIPTICDLLPNLTECLEIEEQKANAERTKRISRAKRTAISFEGFSHE